MTVQLFSGSTMPCGVFLKTNSVCIPCFLAKLTVRILRVQRQSKSNPFCLKHIYKSFSFTLKPALLYIHVYSPAALLLAFVVTLLQFLVHHRHLWISKIVWKHWQERGSIHFRAGALLCACTSFWYL